MAPIHDAAITGNLKEVMRLIQKDNDNVDDNDGFARTPLHYASGYGHVEVVSYLLDHGANINRTDDFDATALFHACRSGHLLLVELLLSRGADPTICTDDGRTPLLVASSEGRVDVVRCLVRNKAVRATIDAQNSNGLTSLWHASIANRVEVVKVLVEAGANPMMTDSSGGTPLGISKVMGHEVCITILEVSSKHQLGSQPALYIVADITVMYAGPPYF